MSRLGYYLLKLYLLLGGVSAVLLILFSYFWNADSGRPSLFVFGPLFLGLAYFLSLILFILKNKSKCRLVLLIGAVVLASLYVNMLGFSRIFEAVLFLNGAESFIYMHISFVPTFALIIFLSYRCIATLLQPE